MSDIRDLASSSVAVGSAIEAGNDKKAAEKNARIAEKISDLCAQARRLGDWLEPNMNKALEPFQARGIEGVKNPMLGRLPFLPRRLSLVKKEDGRRGWSVAEVSVLASPRWWWLVASYLGIAGNHRRSPIVIGAKGIILLTTGELCEYFWPKPSRWIVIGQKYKPTEGSSHMFTMPGDYGKLFSKFWTNGIGAHRLATSLEASMFTLAKAALRQVPAEGPELLA